MGEVSVAIRRRATDTNKGMNTRGERRMATVPVSGKRGNICQVGSMPVGCVGLWVSANGTPDWRFIIILIRSTAQHHTQRLSKLSRGGAR